MNPLIAEIRDLIRSARQAAVHSVDMIQVLTNFEIGRRIVEHEQQGSERAEYGKALLKELSAELTAEFGRGFSRSNLEYMRKFYLTYQDRASRISQMPSGKLPFAILQTQSAKSAFPFKLGPFREIGKRTPDHRHRSLQKEERCPCGNHTAQGCQHPCPGISALSA